MFSSRRVPVVRQLTATECGAACLAMILGYHGRKIRLSECRDECGSGRDGATAEAIAQAARRYGLEVRSFSAELERFGELALPAIVHWNFKHFVVVERWSPDAVHVADPARGRVRLSAEEFDRGFTGVALTFAPGEHFERGETPRGFTWRSYVGKILATPGIKGALAQVLATSLLLQALGLALPLFTKVVVDEVLPHGLGGILPMIGLGMVVWVLAQAVTTYLRSRLVIFIQGRLDAEIMIGFFEHLVSLPFRYFRRRSSGDLLMRLSSNTVLRELLTSQTVSAVFDGVLVVTYLALLMAWAPAFGAITLVIGLAQIVLVLATTQRMFGLMQRDLEAEAASQSYLVESLSGIATLKASGAEERASAHWSNLFFRHLNISLQRRHVSAVIEMAMSALQLLAPLTLLLVGAHLVLGGRLSLGAMLALNALAASFLAPLSSLVTTGRSFQLAGAHFDRIADVMEEEPETGAGRTELPPPGAADVSVQGVSFRYDPLAPLVIRDVSFEARAGEKLAIVGPTGSGKSTLALLILGLHEPTEGEVRLGGRPYPALDPRALRRRFGVVMQEPVLFSGTIRENIAFNDPDRSLPEIEDAARLAGIHHEITAFPMGFETLLSEGGAGLSGGQRQRIALARALLTNPSVLLLDEATSHLDVRTEAAIDENLARMSCTRIVIAHRLSTVRNADLILVVDSGAIVERGTHAELLRLGGFYASLVERQVDG